MTTESEPNHQKPQRRWFFFDPVVFPRKILLFIGSREDMCFTAQEGITDLKQFTGNEVATIAKNLYQNYAKSDDEIDGEGISVKSGKHERIYIVRVESFRGTVDNSTSLSHECLHIAMAILDLCGVRETPPYECLCYLHQAMFKKFSIDAFGSCGMLRKDEPSEEERKANEESFMQVKADCEGKGV